MVKILNNTLKAIKKALNEDIFRAHDIIDSLNDNQEKSKNWLVSNLPANINKHLVLAGWYGNLANKLVNARSVDIDPGCKRYGKILYPEIEFATDDLVTYYQEKIGLFDSVICTSCEHIEQEKIEQLFSLKPHNVWLTLQSNNYYEIDSHINCKENLNDFVDELPFIDIYFMGELKLEKYTRFMVIGK